MSKSLPPFCFAKRGVVMADVVDELQIEINAKATKANDVIDRLVGKLDRLTTSLGRVNGTNNIVKGLDKTTTATKKASSGFKGLTSYIGKFYATYFMVIRGIKQLWSSIESTADYIEAFNYFNVALGKIGSDWSYQWEKYGYDNAESYADSFGTRLSERLGKLSGLQVTLGADGQGLLTESGMKNLGLNIQEITQYASQLASVTNSVGQTGEVSLAVASSFTKLAGDISSLFNVDYSSVSKNLQSGLIGQSRALYKYGIDITNATLQTYAYELGLSKTVSEMTQAEKMQLRMIAILDQSKVSWGDLANTINSPSNMIRQFKNNLKEAGMVLGQLFVPILQKVLPVINGVAIAIKRLLVNIANLFGVKIDFDAFGQGYSDIGDGIEDVTDAYDNATSAAKKFKSTTLGIDELNINAPQEEGGSGSSVGGGGIDLTDEILKATEQYEKAWQEAFDKMESKAQAFADKFDKIFKPVKKLFKDISIGDWFAVGKDFSSIVVGITNFFTKAIESVDWYGLGQKMGDYLAGIDWTSILQSSFRLFKVSIKSIIEFVTGSFKKAPLESAIIGFLAMPSLVSFAGKIKKFFVEPIKRSYAVIAPIGNKIAEMFVLWSTGAGTLGESFMTVFGAGGLVTGALGTLAVGLGITYKNNEDVRKSFEEATSVIKENLKPTLEFLTQKVLPDLRNGWDELMRVLKPLFDFVSGVFVSLWQDFINPTLKYLGEKVLPIVIENFENLWNKILVPFASFLSTNLAPIIEELSELLTELWQKVIVPLGQTVGGVLSKVFENLAKIFGTVVIPTLEKLGSTFSFIYEKVLSPLVGFIVKKFSPIISESFYNIGRLVEELGQTFSGIIDFITGVFTGDWSRAWNGVVEIFDGIFGGIKVIAISCINGVIGAINGAISSIEGVINGAISIFNHGFSTPEWMQEIGGAPAVLNANIAKVNLPRIPKIEGYELGGFPEDGWFRASHGEIMGQFDNGQSVVANNMQIVDGISLGVREAVAEVLVPYLSDISRNTRETADKDMSVNIGDREIARANARGNKLIGNFIVT